MQIYSPIRRSAPAKAKGDFLPVYHFIPSRGGASQISSAEELQRFSGSSGGDASDLRHLPRRRARAIRQAGLSGVVRAPPSVMIHRLPLFHRLASMSLAAPTGGGCRWRDSSRRNWICAVASGHFGDPAGAATASGFRWMRDQEGCGPAKGKNLVLAHLHYIHFSEPEIPFVFCFLYCYN